LTEAMIEALEAAGFDVVHRFDARAVAAELALPALSTYPVGVLVGNTKRMWSRFVAARAPGPDPLERYVEGALEPLGAPTFYAHRRYDGGFLPFQRIAVAAGLGSLSATHLVIHPTFGPWFALRAILLVESAPPPRVTSAPVCTCGAACESALAVALAGDDWRQWLAVRDACPVGRSWRYGDAQLRYHYTKDPSALL
jgi:methylmalonic aciduria homocystinuria type C protein